MGVISNLEELAQVQTEELAQTFLDSLDHIFTYSKVTIVNKLKERNIETLKPLREALLVELIKTYPEYTGKTPVDRMKQNTISEDIFILGSSLANTGNGQTGKHCDLDKVFNIKKNEKPSLSTEQMENITDLGTVLVIVTDLKTTVENLQTTVENLQK
ncbi:unnamed protein product, partial [Meganyctiphanes norvegica]